MVDSAFKPERISVSKGETVRFLFTNRGTLTHEAFIGDRRAQADHEAEMRKSKGSDHDDHGQDAATTVKPGGRGQLSHTFREAGLLEIGCHEPGHYAAGMLVSVAVE